MTDNKYYKFYSLKEKLVSELLRSEIYLPFGLESLKYKTIFTDTVPMGAPACTDFKHIFINPENKFYQRPDVKFEQILTFVFLHEICHNLFMHEKRGLNRDPELWNYATDFFINLFLYNLEIENNGWETQHKLALMNLDKYTDQVMFDEKFNNMIEEEIYNELQQNGSYTKKQSQQSYKDFLDKVGVPNDNIPSDAKVTITQSELNYGGKIYKKVNVEFPVINSDVSNSEKESQELDASISKIMFENRIKDRGFQNKMFEGFVKRLFGVKIPWDTILRDSLLTDLTKKGDISYSRPSKVWLCNPTLPYLTTITENDELGSVVLCIDESGSISHEDIGKAIDIVNQAKSYYKNTLVLKHDTVCKWQKLYSDELTAEDISELSIRQHCGGTSHKDVFTKINEFSKQEDVIISIILCVTDLVSDVKETQNIIPNNIPRIYLQSGDYEIEGIIGKVIKIQ